MKVIKGKALRDYFMEHVKPHADWRYFYTVTKPLKAFKKVYTRNKFGTIDRADIANLIIPVGATVYAQPDSLAGNSDSHDRKMRASEAEVHSIFTLTRPHAAVDSAHAGFNSHFVYKPGEAVRPSEEFSLRRSQCDSGIHFFLNCGDALRY